MTDMAEVQAIAASGGRMSQKLATKDLFVIGDEDSFKEVPGIPVPYQVWQGVTERISELSGGDVALHWFRRTPGSQSVTAPWHMHEFDHIISIVLKGWARFEFEGIGEVLLKAGSVMYQPSNNLHREIESSSDFEGMEFTVKAKGKHTFFMPDGNGDIRQNVMTDM